MDILFKKTLLRLSKFFIYFLICINFRKIKNRL